MGFEVGKQYKYAEGTKGYVSCDLKPGDVFTCHAVDDDGDCCTKDVCFYGVPANESATKDWCVATKSMLERGTVIPA